MYLKQKDLNGRFTPHVRIQRGFQKSRQRPFRQQLFGFLFDAGLLFVVHFATATAATVDRRRLGALQQFRRVHHADHVLRAAQRFRDGALVVDRRCRHPLEQRLFAEFVAQRLIGSRQWHNQQGADAVPRVERQAEKVRGGGVARAKERNGVVAAVIVLRISRDFGDAAAARLVLVAAAAVAASASSAITETHDSRSCLLLCYAAALGTSKR